MESATGSATSIIRYLVQEGAPDKVGLGALAERPAYLLAILLFLWAIPMFLTAQSVEPRNRKIAEVIEGVAIILTIIGSAVATAWMFL